MKYWNIEQNVEIHERYELVMSRIAQIYEEGAPLAADEGDHSPFEDYFMQVSKFVLAIAQFIEKQESHQWEQASFEELKQENEKLYQSLTPDHYETCYANPAFAASRLGEAFGQLLSMVYAEMTGMIVYAYEHRYGNVTIFAELLVALYNIAETDEDTYSQMKDTVYWFMSDYADILVPERIKDLLDPKDNFAVSLIMNSDLSDLRYLYRFGEAIGSQELQLADYMNHLPQETIDLMVDNFVDGYLRGYEVYKIDFSTKKTVEMRFSVGLERLVKGAVKRFEAMGVKTIIYRKGVCSLNKRQNIHNGYSAYGPNRQFEYDHRFDDAIYFDKKFKERKLEIIQNTYEECKQLCASHGGPIYIEGFGEEQVQLVRKQEALAYTAAQQKLTAAFRNEQMELINQYINPEEDSFCIVSYPVPAIGPDFKEIFDATIKVNTLDYSVYQVVQQHLIDTLDQADRVHILGANGNETDIVVSLWDCEPKTQTKFENCLADVNIPLGEVFTSPRLTGTNGLLHVKRVFLNGQEYDNLKIYFKDGMISDYSCTNFENADENRQYVHENVLYMHKTLPLGEFAIGTNTTAYAMGKKFNIFDKLDILIAEKTGPHFAVGDTCYSHSEEHAVYNPDGKEIIARDNEVVRMKDENPEGAYFACHTDITIPYDELGSIDALKGDKTVARLIEAGRFVLPGTKILNEELDHL